MGEIRRVDAQALLGFALGDATTGTAWTDNYQAAQAVYNNAGENNFRATVYRDVKAAHDKIDALITAMKAVGLMDE